MGKCDLSHREQEKKKAIGKELDSNEDGFRSKFEQSLQKLITKNLLIARQLLEYYLKQLTLVYFSKWPRD